MAYRFAGFLIRPALPTPTTLADNVRWRQFEKPFSGSAIIMDRFEGHMMEREEILDRARAIGVDHAEAWIFLIYETWAGKIDFVFGLGHKDGNWSGPFKSDDEAEATARYLELMATLNVLAEDAMHFEPFSRGF